MKFENNMKCIAEDGKVFEGEKCVEECYKHEIQVLEKKLREEKWKRVPKQKVYIPCISFENGIEEYDMVYLKNKDDFEILKDVIVKDGCGSLDCLDEPYEYPYYGILIHDDYYYGLFDLESTMKDMVESANRMKLFMQKNK